MKDQHSMLCKECAEMQRPQHRVAGQVAAKPLMHVVALLGHHFQLLHARQR